MSGKQVVTVDEYVAKLRAAVEARRNKDFVIVARTDAREPLGLDEAIRRGNKYRNAGADAILIEAPPTVEELKMIAKSIDAPLVANITEGGKTPSLSAEDLQRIGFRLVLFSLTALFAATYAIREVLQTLKTKGVTKSFMNRMVTFEKFNELIDLEKYKQLEQKYSNM